MDLEIETTSNVRKYSADSPHQRPHREPYSPIKRRSGDRAAGSGTIWPMSLSVTEQRGVRIVEGTRGAALMRVPQDATLLLEACFSAGSRSVLLHSENVTPQFFDLAQARQAKFSTNCEGFT